MFQDLEADEKITIFPNGDEGVKKTISLYFGDKADRKCWMKALHTVVSAKDPTINPNSKREGYLRVGNKKAKLFCILLDDRLNFYKSIHDTKECLCVMLPGGGETSLDVADPSVFYVAPTGDEAEKVTACFCENSGDTKRWVRSIKDILQAKSSQTNTNSLHEGYLYLSKSYNKDKNKGKKRYCVLLPEGLQYFKSRNDSKAEGFIALSAGAQLKIECLSKWVRRKEAHKAEKAEVKYLRELKQEELEKGTSAKTRQMITFIISLAPSGDEGELVHYLHCGEAVGNNCPFFLVRHACSHLCP